MSKRLSKAAFRALRVRLGRVEEELAAADRLAREVVDAQVAGGHARLSGRTAATNPYPVGTHQRRAWAAGWNAEHQRLGARRMVVRRRAAS